MPRHNRKNRKILVTGGDGQVGRELAAFRRVVALPRRQMDITDPDSIAAALSAVRPALVINAAAYTAVDRAENEPEAAMAVNAQGPAHLAAACRRATIPLLHISTDYVFDGRAQQPYREDAPTAPPAVYGKSKLAGEQEIRRLWPQHIILRTSWVFSAHRNNFVKTMLRLADGRHELRVVDDQIGGPTAAADIAATCIQLAGHMLLGRSKNWGIYHYCGRPPVSWFEFCQEIFRQRQDLTGSAPPVVHPIPSTDYPTPAPRPLYSVLDCTKINHRFGIAQPNWRAGLWEVLAGSCIRVPPHRG